MNITRTGEDSGKVPVEKFDGRVTIRVRFRRRTDYEKFRKYILRTDWSYDLDYPMWEELKMDFHCTDDIIQIDKQIIGLLQFGFEVYCCRYQLESHLAEEQYPPEGDTDGDISGEPDLEDFDMKKFCSDLWKSISRPQ